MAHIAKRLGAWRAQIRKKGVSISRTFDTEDEARTWADQEERRIDAGETVKHLNLWPQSTTVADLFDRYSLLVSPTNEGARWEILRLMFMIKQPIFAIRPCDVRPATIAEYRDDRLKTVEAATVNRELNLISAVFSHAIMEWGIDIKENPVKGIRRPKNPPPRVRRISDDERAIIVKELGWDERSQPRDIDGWVAFAFCLALETMMRQGEILSLIWSNVNEARRTAFLPKTKNGESRTVPLSSKALALFAALKRGAGNERVVPIEAGTCGAYFRAALASACIEDLHFHDTRREALTRMSSKLTVVELARASGHSDDLRSLMVYYRPNPEDIAAKLG